MTHFSLSNSSLVVTAFFNNCMSNVQKNDILNVIELKKLKKKKTLCHKFFCIFLSLKLTVENTPHKMRCPNNTGVKFVLYFYNIHSLFLQYTFTQTKPNQNQTIYDLQEGFWLLRSHSLILTLNHTKMQRFIGLSLFMP